MLLKLNTKCKNFSKTQKCIKSSNCNMTQLQQVLPTASTCFLLLTLQNSDMLPNYFFLLFFAELFVLANMVCTTIQSCYLQVSPNSNTHNFFFPFHQRHLFELVFFFSLSIRISPAPPIWTCLFFQSMLWFHQRHLFHLEKFHFFSSFSPAPPKTLCFEIKKGRLPARLSRERIAVEPRAGRRPLVWSLYLLYLAASPLGDDLSNWQDKSSSQKGWVSIDRSVVAALPSTTPRPGHTSSTDDLGPPLCLVSDQESGPHF